MGYAGIYFINLARIKTCRRYKIAQKCQEADDKTVQLFWALSSSEKDIVKTKKSIKPHVFLCSMGC